MRRLPIDPTTPDSGAIEEAAGVIRRGGVVAVPTDTLYGLAADPFNAAAVARVFAIKGRTDRQPVALIAGDRQQVAAYFLSFPAAARVLAAQFWPGPLTLLLDAPDDLAPGISSDEARVGVRVPDHAVARTLCLAAARPLTATSANRSGQPAPSDAEAVARDLGADLDLIVDSGPSPGGPPSTIVDVTGDVPRLIRPGAIPWSAIQGALR